MNESLAREERGARGEPCSGDAGECGVVGASCWGRRRSAAIPRRSPTREETNVQASDSARRLVDRLGVIASALCLVHCLATPLVVALLPLVASERFEGVLAALLVALATLSVGLCVVRGRYGPLVPYGLGLAAVAALHVGDPPEGSPPELALAALAGILMITTHLMSLRAAQPR